MCVCVCVCVCACVSQVLAVVLQVQVSTSTSVCVSSTESAYVAQLRGDLRESQRRLERAELERDSLDSKRKQAEEQLAQTKK